MALFGSKKNEEPEVEVTEPEVEVAEPEDTKEYPVPDNLLPKFSKGYKGNVTNVSEISERIHNPRDNTPIAFSNDWYKGDTPTVADMLARSYAVSNGDRLALDQYSQSVFDATQ